MRKQHSVERPRLGLSARGIFDAASDVYSAAMMVYFALKLVVGDRFWPVALANNLAAWALLPALPLFGRALWLKQWRRAGLTGIVAGGFLWLFGGLFLPRITQAGACAADDGGCAIRLRVMTYNLENDVSDSIKVVEEIRRSGADIVALQEYSLTKAEAVDAALGDQYPYRVHFNDGIPGIGLISKYPIQSAENFTLHSQFLSHIRARIDVDGHSLTVYVAHPEPPAVQLREGGSQFYAPRATPDIAELAALSSSDGSCLLMGDFNTADVADDYQLLVRAGLRDAFREAGYGLGVTWPVGGLGGRIPPLVRIDYIWHTDDFAATGAWVGQATGSDHLPVIADLVWRRR